MTGPGSILCRDDSYPFTEATLMEADFWHSKWERGEIGFHQSRVNPLLAAHFGKLNLPRGARVLLPLCGKTLDIAWLLDRAYRVVGVELSALAVDELFEQLALKPEITTRGDLTRYSAGDLELLVGDIFAVSAEHLGEVDAIYDRAALVALPAETRPRYAGHLGQVSASAPQLLITFEYDQRQMAGPPFSVDQDELARLYDSAYRLQPVGRREVENGLKGKVAATEIAWLLHGV